eukprot:TRINITY_DN32566_c0_g1_i1.p1 TRINITY_DN32566_c0_g1~~TRINITY_DN32566_c0_g1_i1.p1  ORF type:complete len:389 (+),score=121.52 TRINITY_DN32566_c0_g1_i1:82-1248(+)
MPPPKLKLKNLPNRSTDIDSDVRVVNVSENGACERDVLPREISMPQNDACRSEPARSEGGKDERKLRDRNEIVFDPNQKPLGEGAEGQVYLGTVPKLENKPVAVKVMRGCDRNAAPPKEHPKGDNIVKMYSIFYDDDKSELWIVMELMDQGSIADLINRHNQLMNLDLQHPIHRTFPKVAAAIAYQCLHGLNTLHKGAFMHRDVKPDNFLMNKKGEVKLADFGNVRVANTVGEAFTFCGTSCYLSPERLRGDPYSSRGDIWGMGILLLELVMCKQIISSALSDQLFDLMSRVETLPGTLRSFGFSEDLLDFLTQALQVDPKKRPSALDLLSHNFIKKTVPDKSAATSIVRKWIRALKARKTIYTAASTAAVALVALSASDHTPVPLAV